MKTSKKLPDIWKQAPPDYYDQGIKSNLLQYLWHTQKIRTLKKIIIKKNYPKILDIGCASGLMTNKIASFFPESKVVGVDIYSNAIDFAKSKYPQISFNIADIHKLPFASGSFDLIICCETIEHVLNPKKALSEIYRVIKKDGIVIIAMDSGNLLFRLIWWFWEKTKGKVWQGAHLHPFHHLELEEVIQSAGFKIKRKHFSHLGMEVSFVLWK